MKENKYLLTTVDGQKHIFESTMDIETISSKIIASGSLVVQTSPSEIVMTRYIVSIRKIS